MKLPKKIDWDTVRMFLIILVFSVPAFILANQIGPVVDEEAHYEEIKKVIENERYYIPNLATLPGFHLFVGIIAKLLGWESFESIRLIVFVLNLLGIVVFYITIKELYKGRGSSETVKRARLGTLQYAFFPTFFLFLFLIYTDLFSCLLTLFLFYFVLKKDYELAGAIGIMSILVRQNNVVWLFFAYATSYLANYGQLNLEGIKEHSMKCWLFIAAFALFAIFVVLNGGFAIGDRAMHPAFEIHLENVYFMLFIFFFLFLAHNISNMRGIFELLKGTHRNFIVLCLSAVFLVYIITAFNSGSMNPYNDAKSQGFFLRNQILSFFYSAGTVTKILLFLPIGYSILSLAVTKLVKKEYYLIYLAAIIYLIPSWLVEQRYYTIPFALFMLFREKKADSVEYLSIVLNIMLAIVFFAAFHQNKFFL